MDSGIKKFIKKIPLASELGRSVRRGRHYWDFLRDFRQFSKLARKGETRFEVRWEDRFPCLEDRTATTLFDRHYIYHPAWAARILARTRPESHADISSTLYFATLVAAFLPVKFYDFRPADLELSNLACERADLMDLPFASGSVKSLSCMHVVEHIGLGRYGDPLDPEGDRKAMGELQRVLQPGGSLLFVAPVGQSRLQFNAHRIYSYEQIISEFSGLVLEEFTLIPEHFSDGAPILHASPKRVAQERYGCGCFWFKKAL
jgi:SAM-dependent methyltransferase